MNIAEGAEPDDIKKMIDDGGPLEQSPISKEKTLAALTESFAEVHKYLDEVRAQQLTRDMEFFGQEDLRRRGVWLARHRNF